MNISTGRSNPSRGKSRIRVEGAIIARCGSAQRAFGVLGVNGVYLKDEVGSDLLEFALQADLKPVTARRDDGMGTKLLALVAESETFFQILPSQAAFADGSFRLSRGTGFHPFFHPGALFWSELGEDVSGDRHIPFAR